MKSIIVYSALKLPVNSIFNISIVQKKISNSEYVDFVNKLEFTDYVDSLYAPLDVNTYCDITCQCSKKYTYSSKDDVPSDNVICSCGRKVIEFGA